MELILMGVVFGSFIGVPLGFVIAVVSGSFTELIVCEPTQPEGMMATYKLEPNGDVLK